MCPSGLAMNEKTVTRADLCEAVYQKVGLSRTESAALVELVLKEITDCLERGETVKLSSFGSFVVRRKGQRIGRNPKTGTEVPISPRRVMVFKPSAILKQRINQGRGDSGGSTGDSGGSDREDWSRGPAQEAALNKAPEAFRTISEVADELDLPQHVLRFWESRFPHIKPLKRGGGRRYYRREDVELLRGIRRLLYGDGYTIRGVQRILREHGVRIVQSAGQGQPLGLRTPSSEGESEAVQESDARRGSAGLVQPFSAPTPSALDRADLNDGAADRGRTPAMRPAEAPKRRDPDLESAQAMLSRPAAGVPEIPPPQPAATPAMPTGPPARLPSTELDRLERVLAELEACRQILDGAKRLWTVQKGSSLKIRHACDSDLDRPIDAELSD
jgi:integration host factor subunit alpha